MTANQIEYQKLLETRRHNVVTEGYEGDLKRAQADESRASIGLIQAQIDTQGSIQAANLASAASSYASAARQYEAINTEKSQQAYNYAGVSERQANTQYKWNQSFVLEPDVTKAGIRNQMYNDNYTTQYYLTMVKDFNDYVLPGMQYAFSAGMSGASIFGR